MPKWIWVVVIVALVAVIGAIVGSQGGKKSAKGHTQGPAALDWSSVSTILNKTAPTIIAAFAPVCEGKPVQTAAYAGTAHPLAFVGPESDKFSWENWEYDVDPIKYHSDTGGTVPPALNPHTLSQVQLVGCVTVQHAAKTSCGSYTRSSDGASGELFLTQGVATVRIVDASTARTVAQRTFKGEPLNCSEQEAAPSGPPPWTFDGSAPNVETTSVSAFITSFLSGQPRG